MSVGGGDNSNIFYFCPTYIIDMKVESRQSEEKKNLPYEKVTKLWKKWWYDEKVSMIKKPECPQKKIEK